ncbi:MAG: hypothetical protein BJ554DRAFT_5668 [Olpidium bornovanus]|uniref:Pre-mRNA-splicing factor SYF2 n=1 Tax=Olpidium bornovanus TaxID=278681 RepID=A0A8H8DME3_9FUNG|nr:MAG: hypothetical protein BJ554DRAFT_5668 [Olpidium bornovanus]
MAEGTHELTKPKNGGEVTYDRVAIQNVDIIASNGAVHVIPRLFLPSSFKMDTMKYLIATGRTKFVDLLVDAGLSDFLTKRKSTSPLTILTVPNEALEHSSRPMGQMLYHIVPGLHESDSLQDNDLLRTALKSDRLRDENQVVQVMVLDNNGEREVFINDAKIMGDPVIADGVVIYTLSHLLELPVDPLQAIVNDLDLSTFATAVHTAQLAHTVREQQGTTIFVPSNQAFLKNSALMSYLLLPESEKKLAAVLQYHIATQIVYSSEFPQPGKNQNELMMPTLVGQNITVTVGQNGDDLGLHGSQRHEARFQSPRPRNRPTSNGNMFVIDRVLLPDISITVRNLLDGLKMPTFDHLLSEYLSADPEVPALDSSNNEPFTLLVPNESAFASVDIGELGRDPARITCSMRMYFVRGRPEIADGAVWETMCPDVWFKVHSTGDDKWELEMSDKRGSAIHGDDLGRAHVGRRGEARNGDLYEVGPRCNVFAVKHTLLGASDGATFYPIRLTGSSRSPFTTASPGTGYPSSSSESSASSPRALACGATCRSAGSAPATRKSLAATDVEEKYQVAAIPEKLADGGPSVQRQPRRRRRRGCEAEGEPAGAGSVRAEEGARRKATGEEAGGGARGRLPAEAVLELLGRGRGAVGEGSAEEAQASRQRLHWLEFTGFFLFCLREGRADYNQVAHKKYKKLVGELKPNITAYNEAKAAIEELESSGAPGSAELSELLYRDANSLSYGGEDKVSKEAAERLSQWQVEQLSASVLRVLPSGGLCRRGRHILTVSYGSAPGWRNEPRTPAGGHTTRTRTSRTSTNATRGSTRRSRELTVGHPTGGRVATLMLWWACLAATPADCVSFFPRTRQSDKGDTGQFGTRDRPLIAETHASLLLATEERSPGKLPFARDLSRERFPLSLSSLRVRFRVQMAFCPGFLQPACGLSRRLALLSRLSSVLLVCRPLAT